MILALMLACGPDAAMQEHVRELEREVLILRATNEALVEENAELKLTERDKRRRRLSELIAERQAEQDADGDDADGDDADGEDADGDDADDGTDEGGEEHGDEPMCTTAADGAYLLPDLSTHDPGALARMARALLHRDATGAYDGYRLSAIRRGSFLDSCGLHNGDVVNSVNDLTLDSMEDAMNAYNELQSAPSWTMRVTRRGETVDLMFRAP